MPNQIPQNNEATQHLNSPDSSKSLDSHERPESSKISSTFNPESSNTNVQNRQLWNPYTNMLFSNQHPLFTATIATYQRRTKLELSKFDGNKKCSFAWFNKAKEYFEIYDIDNDDEKIRHASMKMEGEAYNWYMWWKKTTLAISWRKFKNVFFKRIQGVKEEELLSTLTRLEQKGDVDE